MSSPRRPPIVARRPSGIISCVGVRKAFGGHRVLDGVDCDLPEGQITVIMGPSGTGKSVLLRHFVGLLMPDAGGVGKALMASMRVLGTKRALARLEKSFRTGNNYSKAELKEEADGLYMVVSNAPYPEWYQGMIESA